LVVEELSISWKLKEYMIVLFLWFLFFRLNYSLYLCREKSKNVKYDLLKKLNLMLNAYKLIRIVVFKFHLRFIWFFSFFEIRNSKLWTCSFVLVIHSWIFMICFAWKKIDLLVYELFKTFILWSQIFQNKTEKAEQFLITYNLHNNDSFKT
jgi:hypothetical protein